MAKGYIIVPTSNSTNYVQLHKTISQKCLKTNK